MKTTNIEQVKGGKTRRQREGAARGGKCRVGSGVKQCQCFHYLHTDKKNENKMKKKERFIEQISDGVAI